MRSMMGAAVLVLVVSGAGPALAQVQPPQDRINTAIERGTPDAGNSIAQELRGGARR